MKLRWSRIWSGKDPRFTGIEIERTGMRIAEVRAGAEGPVVTTFAFLDLPGEEEVPQEMLSEMLARAVKETKISPAHVISCIPSERLIIRHIRIPSIPVKEIEPALKWEAERYIPVSLDQLILRHVVLGEEKGERGPELRVLLVAAPEKLVRDYYKAFREAGLNLVALDLQALALWRLFAQNRVSGNSRGYVILEVESRTSQFMVVQNRAISYVRLLPQGSFALAGERSTAEVSENDAGARSLGGLIFQAALEDYARHVRRSLDWYLVQERGQMVEKIVLCGGLGNLQGIDRKLEELLGIPVVIEEPLLQFNSVGEQNYDPSYAVALGLALRELVR